MGEPTPVAASEELVAVSGESASATRTGTSDFFESASASGEPCSLASGDSTPSSSDTLSVALGDLVVVPREFREVGLVLGFPSATHITVRFDDDTQHDVPAADVTLFDHDAPLTSAQRLHAGTHPDLQSDDCELCIDWAQALARGVDGELQWLQVHCRTRTSEFVWAIPTTTLSSPHLRLDQFMSVLGRKLKAIRYDNASEFATSTEFET